ncbi:MAG: hypothetical protein LBQ98_09830 [Nitrososphaerota archaeon]|nr:hypothetical protein [Nitrososphaerota archaeon]
MAKQKYVCINCGREAVSDIPRKHARSCPKCGKRKFKRIHAELKLPDTGY